MLFFFFNDTATTEIYTLSLHDALPISPSRWSEISWDGSAISCSRSRSRCAGKEQAPSTRRSEEHTSELQSLAYLVCRLLLEKKNKIPPLSSHLAKPLTRLFGLRRLGTV